MAGVQWQEPPPPNLGSSRSKSAELDDFARALRGNPGKWAYVGTSKTNGGYQRKYRIRGLEVTTRMRPDGARDVYVRAPHDSSSLG